MRQNAVLLLKVAWSTFPSDLKLDSDRSLGMLLLPFEYRAKGTITNFLAEYELAADHCFHVLTVIFISPFNLD